MIPHTPQRGQVSQPGFSLVELMVALVFMSLLMSGMAVVFRSSTRTFTTTGETLSTQHRGRWALEQINDDISQAGFLFPERVLPLRIQSGVESLFMVTPDQAILTHRPSDTNPDATEAETITADAFQFFMDMPLPVQGLWTADTLGDNPSVGGIATAAPASAAVTFTLGSEQDLRAGDIELIADSGEYGNWEHPLIGSPVSNPIVFETSTTELEKYTLTPLTPGIVLPHPAGVPVYFIRPAQLIRFSVRAVALDPANAAVRVPCLVRQQANYPDNAGGLVDWEAVPAQVVAENVSGFRVDLSFDGGATWTRPTAAPTWAGFQANANTTLSTKGLAGFQTITDPGRRDWFRNIPCLIRIDLSTRTSVRREEYSPAQGTRSWRTRMQTLMISPRNFGVGS